jgi:hypothetical protein
MGALHIVLNVIKAKPKVCDNLPVATILVFPIIVCWSRSVFKACGNPSSAPDISGCLLDMAFIIWTMQNPSNVPLWHIIVKLQCRWDMRQFIFVITHYRCPCKFCVGCSRPRLHLRLWNVDLVKLTRVAIINWSKVQLPLCVAKDRFALKMHDSSGGPLYH